MVVLVILERSLPDPDELALFQPLELVVQNLRVPNLI